MLPAEPCAVLLVLSLGPLDSPVGSTRPSHPLQGQARATMSLKSFSRIRCQTEKKISAAADHLKPRKQRVPTAARLSDQGSSVGPHAVSSKARR